MILLDTHFCVWLVDKPAAVRMPERQVLRENIGNIVASAVSLWELRLKWAARYSSGERKGPLDPRTVATTLVALDIPIVEMSPLHAITPLDVPVRHKDPFDILLLVQAQELGAKLLTRDKLLADHPLALVPE